MTQIRRQWVATFGGLGSDGLSTVTPIPISEVANAAAAGVGKSAPTTRFMDAYEPALTSIDFGAQSCSPIGGDPLGGTCTMTIALTRDETRRYFGQRTAVQPIGRLLGTSALSWPLTGPTFLTDRTDEPLSAYDIVWIQDMALRVASISGNAVTLTNVMPDDVGGQSWDLETEALDGLEGHFGTFLRGIAARGGDPPFVDGYIYTQRPRLRGLPVAVYRADGASIEEQVWRGFISKYKIIAGGTAVRVECVDALQSLRKKRLNRKAVIIPATVAFGNALSPVLTGGGYVNAGAESIYAATSEAWVQAEKTVIKLTDYVSDFDARRRVTATDDRAARWGSESMDFREGASSVTIVELLPTDAAAISPVTNHPLYTTDTTIDGGAAGSCSNPFDLIRAFLGTVDTQLPQSWRVWRSPSLAAVYVDDAQIVALRDSVATGMTWPGLLLGRDGKDIGALDLITGICQPLGIGLAVGTDGRLTLRTLRDGGYRGANALDWDDIEPGGISEDVDGDAAFDSVHAVSAHRWDGIDRLTITIASAVVPPDDLEDVRKLTFDAAGLVSPEGVDLDTLPEVADYQAFLSFVWRLFRVEPQIIQISATPETDVAIGTWLTLQTRQLMDRDTGGPPTDYTSVSAFVLKRKVSADSGAQALDCLVVPYADDGRISGSATVTGQTHGVGVTTLTCSATTWIGAAGYAAGPTTISTDVQQFSAGDVCVAVSKRMVSASDPFTIGSVGTNQLVDCVDVATAGRVQTAGGGSDYTSAAGDTVILANLASATTGTKAVYAWFGTDDYQI